MIFISLHIYSVRLIWLVRPHMPPTGARTSGGCSLRPYPSQRLCMIIRTSKYFNKICNCSIQLYRLMWRSDYIVGFLSLNHSFQQNIWLQSDIIFTCTWLITGIQGTHRNQVGRKLTSSTPTPFKCLTWCKQNWGPVRALRFISTGPSKNCLLITDRDSRYFKHAIIF